MRQNFTSDEALNKLERDTFWYFLKLANPANGLVPDNTRPGAPASIAAIGLALAAYTVGVERAYMTREEAVQRTLTTLQFFWNSPQSEAPDATGYKGFYYHFLDMQSGRRVWESELSTIDTAFLLAGFLAAAVYFDRDVKEERAIRTLADALFRRVDWQWAQKGGATLTHGWRPESGFIPYRWEGYNEALLLYALALGSPTHPLPTAGYQAWMQTYQWRELYGYEFLFAGTLFIHQLSHCWIDFRGIQDEFMRAKGIDYFENSRRATFVQQQYAIHNPNGFKGYNENCWGITASDGPGPAVRELDGISRSFYDYEARSLPDGLDDGTIAPWAAVASLPFAPEIVLPAIQYFNETHAVMTSEYGAKCSFNPTFTTGAASDGYWVSPGHFGIDQGPVVLMIENYRTGFFWRLMQQCPYLVTGLRRAGFTNGWL